MPARRTLILSCRHSEVGWPVPFLAAFNFPSVATRYPIAAGWTVGEYPNYDPRVRLEPSMFSSAVKRSNHLATSPCLSLTTTTSICKNAKGWTLRFISPIFEISHSMYRLMRKFTDHLKRRSNPTCVSEFIILMLVIFIRYHSVHRFLL